jgi:hypothetical protein
MSLMLAVVTLHGHAQETNEAEGQRIGIMHVFTI